MTSPNVALSLNFSVLKFMLIFLKILYKLFHLPLCCLICHPIMYNTLTQYGKYVLDFFLK